MANEFIARKGLISLSDTQLTGSLLVSASQGSGVDLYVSGSATLPRVGIGSTSPAHPLDVHAASGARIKVNETGGSNIDIAAGGAGGNLTSDGHLTFRTGGPTERMHITTAGDVGINATKRLYLDGYAATGNTYITEASADQINLVTSGSTAMAWSSAQDTIIPATKKLFLDGSASGDTYIYEHSANLIRFYCGGTENISLQNDDVIVPSAGKIYHDGGIDTYTTLISNNIIGWYCGNTESMRLTDGTCTITGDISGSGDLDVDGSITGSAFIGDGSQLTGLSSAAIDSYTNNANNRVITSVDSSTVNAEANLTFDGSTLITTGVVSASGNIDSDGSITGSAGVSSSLGEFGSVTITAGTITGITDLTVADGGTGASTLTDGGVLLGSGTDAITAMSVLSDGEMIVGDGSGDPVAESGATLRTSIGVGTGDSPQFTAVNIGAASDTTLARSSAGVLTVEGNRIFHAGGTDVPVADGGTGASTLTDGGVLLGSGTSAITAMAVLSDGEMIVGDGTTDPVAESGATLRTSVGVGTGDSPQFTGIELGHASDTTIVRASSGDITIEGNAVYRAGGTDVPVADGGTGTSSLTDGGVLLGSGTGAITAMAALGDGEIVIGDGSGDPTTLDVGASGGITILGTIATGVWNGTAIDTAYIDTTLTAQTSILNTSLVIGRDADNDIDFATDNNIRFRAGGEDQLTLVDGALTPSSNAIVDLGTDALEFKDLYIDGTAYLDSATITAGTITGITDLVVADGGTGASTFTDGGVLLGSGTDAITAMAVLADSEMIVGDGTTDPVAESGATLRTSIGVGTGDSPQFTGIELGHASDTTIVRASSGDITIEGNAVYRAGGTDVPVADGGTGASSLTDGGVLLGSGTGAITAMSVLGDGEILIGDASGDPATLDVGSSTAITIVGALDAGGSITSGFGAIDVGSSNIDGGTITADTAFVGTLSTAAQTNITSVGTLTGLTVSSLTSGRVVLAGTSGVLQDDGGLTYNTGTNTLTTDYFVGALNGIVGGSTPADASFTTLSATGNVSFTAGVMAIGSTANAAVALNLTSNDMAGTSQYGINLNPTFTSDATTAGWGLRTGPATDNASFTMTTMYGIQMLDGTDGSGSTITTLYGLKIENQTSGGTNYAIHTGTGDVVFGDDVTISGDLAVTGKASANLETYLTPASGWLSNINMGDANDLDGGKIQYHAGNDDMQFFANGTLALKLDSSQDVNIPNGGLAIGTTSSPEKGLHVIDAGSVTSLFESSGDANSFIMFQSNTSTDNQQVRIGANGDDMILWAGDSHYLRLDSGGNLAMVQNKKLLFDGVAGTGDTYLISPSADRFQLHVGGEEFADIQQGTGSPYYVLGNYNDMECSVRGGTSLSTGYLRIDRDDGNIAIHTVNPGYRFQVNGNTYISGTHTVSSTKSFSIDHPLASKRDTHRLIHSVIEGPRADLMYRGKVALSSGTATVNIDTAEGMTEGTFEVLCRADEAQVWVQNNSGWDAVRGSVSGNTLTINCQDTNSTAEVSWIVVAERQDPDVKTSDVTDSDGRIIVELVKNANFVNSVIETYESLD